LQIIRLLGTLQDGNNIVLMMEVFRQLGDRHFLRFFMYTGRPMMYTCRAFVLYCGLLFFYEKNMSRVESKVAYCGRARMLNLLHVAPQYQSGGDLEHYTYAQKAGYIPEAKARDFFRQIVSGTAR
jgi:hypothetical protein